MGQFLSYYTTPPSYGERGGAPVRKKADAIPGTSEVVGEILEVLSGFGLAHLRTDSGVIYGVNRKTPGITFDTLHVGQHLRCEVTEKFSRVLRAVALD